MWIPLVDCEVPERMEVPVQRFRCARRSEGDPCERTFSWLPPFLLRLKRYAAQVVQTAWERWASGKGYADVAESLGLPSEATVKTWLNPLLSRTASIGARLQRLAGLEGDSGPPGAVAPSEEDHALVGKANRPRRVGAQALLVLARSLLDRLRLAPADRHRVPYHFALVAAEKELAFR